MRQICVVELFKAHSPTQDPVVRTFLSPCSPLTLNGRLISCHARSWTLSSVGCRRILSACVNLGSVRRGQTRFPPLQVDLNTCKRDRMQAADGTDETVRLAA
jgi:hypothetical protein